MCILRFGGIASSRQACRDITHVIMNLIEFTARISVKVCEFRRGRIPWGRELHDDADSSAKLAKTGADRLAACRARHRFRIHFSDGMWDRYV